METEGGVRRLVEDLRRDKDEKEKAVLFGRVANRPASTAAPAAPATAAGSELVLADQSELAAGLAKTAARAPVRLGLRQRALGGAASADKLAQLVEEPAAEFFNADGKKREEARRFFQKLDRTKEWAENNYYHLPIEQQLADLVTVNDFWADYALHDGQTPFLSKSFTQATRNFTEMMLALAVLDLPFKAGHARGKAGRPAIQPARPARR